jgi:hypothetical protein
MAAINISDEDCWIVGRWAFRTILKPTMAALPDDKDKEIIERALALDGLHLPLIDQVQARRIAFALAKVAEEMRVSLSESDPTTLEPIYLELIEYLRAIQSSIGVHYA